MAARNAAVFIAIWKLFFFTKYSLVACFILSRSAGWRWRHLDLQLAREKIFTTIKVAPDAERVAIVTVNASYT